MGKSLMSCFLTHGVQNLHPLNITQQKWKRNIQLFHFTSQSFSYDETRYSIQGEPKNEATNSWP